MLPILAPRPLPLTRNAINAAADRLYELACHTAREREMADSVYRLLGMYPRCATAEAVENLTDQLRTRLHALAILLAEQHGHIDGAVANLSLAAESSIRDSALVDYARLVRNGADHVATG